MQADVFWQFSLSRYGEPGVKEACLRLQDQYGLNVNMLLLCDFLYARQLSVSSEEMSELVRASVPTDETLAALRRHRKTLKLTDPEKYKLALEDELQVEKQQQTDLINALDNCVPHSSDSHPIYLYLDVMKSKHDLPSDLLAPFLTSRPGE